ncbi:zinc finger protein 862-like [Ruditapes philippinarum]|uniref:zinc finger protein 862-like n=1 Tax=Ruditapes philippinarum TaxID=129788 RepID=UPI00295A6204|nr:zinc finger protein 862-like [Ruditapes philippinarum]
MFAAQKHLDAIARSTMQPQKALQKMVEAKLDKDDELGIKLLTAAYHIGKRELPKEEFRHHLEFASAVGADYGTLLTEKTKLTYCSNKSVTELQAAISSVILEDKISGIHKSGIFSLVLDESIDNANKKRLIMYAQYIAEEGLEYALLSNQQIKTGSASAVNIVKMVVDELKHKNIDITKMAGISTDGASVMTGRTGGVVTLLRKHTPSLVGVHCAAHRTALATSQAAKDIPEINNYARTVSNVFRYFSNSALRSNRLRDIQSVLNLPELKFSEVHSVRWLSLEYAVKAIYRSYPALVMCLERDATLDSTAKGLFLEVSQYRFIAFTHLMMDVLPYITRLSKHFQSDSLDFSGVQSRVTSTCDSLRDLLEVSGVFVSKLDEFIIEKDGAFTYSRPIKESDSTTVKLGIEENREFVGFESDSEDDNEENTGFAPNVKFYAQQKNILDRVAPSYVNKVVENLEARFTDSEIIDSMKVLVPQNIAKSDTVAKYGNDEFLILVKQYQPHLSSEHECLSEYRQYKNLVKCSYRDETLVELCKIFISKYSEEYPNMVNILKCVTVLPMNSVKCERGFSTQNRIMGRLRTSMNNQTMDDLMRISEDGPCMKSFDFKRALKKWKTAKKRLLYSK